MVVLLNIQVLMAIRVITSYNTITGEKTPNLENMIPFQLRRSANAKLFSICNWQNSHELQRIRVAISRTDSRAKRLYYDADFQTHVPTFRGSNLGFLKTKAGLRHQKPDVQDHPYVTAASTRTCKELVQKTRRSADCVASAARYRGLSVVRDAAQHFERFAPKQLGVAGRDKMRLFPNKFRRNGSLRCN